MTKKNENWDLIIQHDNIHLLNFKLIEILKYKDLIWLLVKRDFTTFYKQTILGPLWYIIQPLINAIVFTIIFGKLAKISTEGIPPFIFYMSGSICWAYFSSCINLTSKTFTDNVDIFGKVFFPRITVPISHVIISLLQFLIQFIIFLFFLTYFIYQGSDLKISLYIVLLPIIVFQMAILSLGFGLLISSLTTKYKDLSFVMSFFLQLWMFATPIVYPLSIVPEKYRIYIAMNPMTSVVEIFRYFSLGSSSISIVEITISLIVTILVLFFGLILFSKMEKNFMDTI